MAAVDMRPAIVKSCNTYFYTMGHRLGYDRYRADRAKLMGLGEEFDLPRGIAISVSAPCPTARGSMRKKYDQRMDRRRTR